VIALPVPRPYGPWGVTNTAIEASYPDAVAALVDELVNTAWTVTERGGGEPVRVAPRHVCLMFRRFQSYGRDLTRPYVRALEARGIPHVLMGGRSFHEREEIAAARNALSAIEWPGDELSVYATLKGPFFAFHDEDLIAFRHAHHRLHPLAWLDPDRRAALADAATAPAPTNDAPSPQTSLPIGTSLETSSPVASSVPNPATEPTGSARVAIAGALAILGELHARRNRRPIADTLARLLAATRAHAGLAVWPAGEQALANLFRVMDLARRFETTGATSFRAFVERLESDAERGRQPDAPVVEDGTEGVRIMTVHAAKGLEFPVVILCDPTAPLSADRPSHFIDPSRDVWLESLAGCVPSELRDHEVEVMQHDREEGERLAYVAVTRARDLLVVPVVGDEERESWLQALDPVVFPDAAKKRKPEPMPGYAFGDDSVVERSSKTDRMPTDSVAPGIHRPRAGSHSVVWWDPHKLALGTEPGGGVRRREILQADEANDNVAANAGIAAHAAWQHRRATALAAGARPTITVKTVTAAAELAAPATIAATTGAQPTGAQPTGAPPTSAPPTGAAPTGAAPTGAPPTGAPPTSAVPTGAPPAAGLLAVRLETVAGKRAGRPRGKRFGTLVHAILAAVELRGDADHVRRVGANQARLVGATPEERDAAIVAVRAALAHPLMLRAADAADRGALRREVPVVVAAADGLIEGVVDLAFEEAGAWTVVDFKTDAEIDHRRPIYEAQVRAYAHAIGVATQRAANPVLLIV
jgi:ATP-dependent helicase/nuclease subunit A